MKRDIVYIHLPSKRKAPKLEAASQTVCRWGSWMGWIDDCRLEARMPPPLPSSSVVSCGWGWRLEGGSRGRCCPPPLQSSSIVGPPQKGQLLCLAPPPVLAVMCVCWYVWMFITVCFIKFISVLKNRGAVVLHSAVLDLWPWIIADFLCGLIYSPLLSLHLFLDPCEFLASLSITNIQCFLHLHIQFIKLSPSCWMHEFNCNLNYRSVQYNII